MLPLLLTTTASVADEASQEVVAELGPVLLRRGQVETLVGSGLRILLVLLATVVVIRVLNRIINRAVEGVRNPHKGPVDRFRSRDTVWKEDEREDEIAQLRRLRRAEALASVGRSVVAVALWTLSVMTILSTVNIELGPYIAGLGIIGVALGFGAQDLVKDFLSGVFMLLEDQYGVGDVVDAGAATGTVEGISLRTTRIRSVDGTLWFVPNGEVRALGNMSQGWARALLDVGVAYDADVDHAQDVIREVAETMAGEEEFAPKFLAAPSVWGVQNLGPDSVDIRLVIQTTPGDQWAIGRELRRRLKMALDENGIEIPFPQRTMWIRTEGEGRGTPPEIVPTDDDAPTSA